MLYFVIRFGQKHLLNVTQLKPSSSHHLPLIHTEELVGWDGVVFAIEVDVGMLEGCGVQCSE